MFDCSSESVIENVETGVSQEHLFSFTFLLFSRSHFPATHANLNVPLKAIPSSTKVDRCAFYNGSLDVEKYSVPFAFPAY